MSDGTFRIEHPPAGDYVVVCLPNLSKLRIHYDESEHHLLITASGLHKQITVKPLSTDTITLSTGD